MKTKIIYQGIALLAMALITAACQNELNEESTEPKPGEKINMTIRATQGTGPQTRTDYEDKLEEGTAGNIVVKWEGGTADNATVENIKVFGYSDGASEFTHSGDMASKPETLSGDRLSITFDGDITVANNYLAVYPASNCNLDEGSLGFDFSNQTQDCSAGQQMAHLKTYDIMAGQPVDGGTTDNFEFEHKASMLRFDLTLPTEESINKITLTNTIKKLSTGMYAILAGKNIIFEGYGDVNSISLAITNHTSSKTLKAYMMTAPCDLSDDELTITVKTESGNTYIGKLTTNKADLKAGLCYTLTSTLTLNTITVESTKGNLATILKNISDDELKRNELAVTGKANSDDIYSLARFLKDPKAVNITTIDLSKSTIDIKNYPGEVKNLDGCTKIENIILPNTITIIGSSAFEGCTALTTVTQNVETTTRTSMPKGVITIKDNAFKNCTSMTEMFLHDGIILIELEAFFGCSSLKALVFEGDKPIGYNYGKPEKGNIQISENATEGTNEDLKIFLPNIKDLAKANDYLSRLNRPTYYGFKGTYATATQADKMNTELYTKAGGDSNGTSPTLPPGNNWGE